MIGVNKVCYLCPKIDLTKVIMIWRIGQCSLCHNLKACCFSVNAIQCILLVVAGLFVINMLSLLKKCAYYFIYIKSSLQTLNLSFQLLLNNTSASRNCYLLFISLYNFHRQMFQG